LHTIFQVIVRLGNNCNCNDIERKIEDLKTRTLEVISPEVKGLRGMYQYYII